MADQRVPPRKPIGPFTVSSEGACAAYYNFGRLHREAAVTLGRARAQLGRASRGRGRRAGRVPRPRA